MPPNQERFSLTSRDIAGCACPCKFTLCCGCSRSDTCEHMLLLTCQFPLNPDTLLLMCLLLPRLQVLSGLMDQLCVMTASTNSSSGGSYSKVAAA